MKSDDEQNTQQINTETILKLKTIFTSITLVLASSAAFADYPERAVRIVVPYAPGGAVDAVMRKLAQQLTEQTGKAFVVDNKAGATGTIGASQVVHSKPDGYTLMANDTTYTTLPFVFKSLNWNPSTDLVPVSAFMFAPMTVAVRKESRFKTLKDLLNAAKSGPGEISYGTGGVGSLPHLTTEAMQQASKTKMMHVPFKGAGEATIAVLGGTVDFQIASTPGIISQFKNGTMRVLAISGEKNLPQLSGVPTFKQAGLDFDGVTNFGGLWVPKGTPPEILRKLQDEVATAMKSSSMRSYAESIGADPSSITSTEFKKMIAERQKEWDSVAHAINLEKQ